MKSNFKTKVKKFPNFLLGLVLMLMSNLCFAQTIIINGNQIINQTTKYDHVVLDMTNGSFTLTKNSLLEIKDCIINITISAGNPFFATLNQGHLVLGKNVFNVTTSGITPNSHALSLYHLIQVNQGTLNLTGNQFTVDKPFTVGFITTNLNFITEGFKIYGNRIQNFHGGIYLYNSNNAEINDNSFENVSYANIFNIGNMSNYKRNIFSFPGNLSLGDAIDIINSDSITIEDNIIASGSNYGIYIMGGQHLFIDNNKITDGLAYGIFIQAPTPILINKNSYLTQLLAKYKMKSSANSAISITNNYIAQNRYGLAGDLVQGLIAEDNIFIQRFNDSASRQYWTNNDVLLASATNVTWVNNLYKEAFTQDNEGDNSNALNFVSFPAHGGVSLP